MHLVSFILRWTITNDRSNKLMSDLKIDIKNKDFSKLQIMLLQNLMKAHIGRLYRFRIRLMNTKIHFCIEQAISLFIWIMEQLNGRLYSWIFSLIAADSLGCGSESVLVIIQGQHLGSWLLLRECFYTFLLSIL